MRPRVRCTIIQSGMKLSLFIQNHFHPKSTFIPKPLSSQVHFHPKSTFIPSPLSSPDPLRQTAQNFALVLPSPATIFILSSLSWGPFVEFWVFLKRRGHQMCTFGVLGLSCEATAAPKLVSCVQCPVSGGDW